MLSFVGFSSVNGQKKNNVQTNAKPHKILYEYFPYSTRIQNEYQIDALTGAKDGYYKIFNSNSLLIESGFYKMGKINGTKTNYDGNGTGQIWATFQYKDGLQQGSYKQWCFEGSKRYLCTHRIYDNDKLVSEIRYYANGNKEFERGPDYYRAWFDDGSPKIETKNGKTFYYGQGSHGGVDFGKATSIVVFDSLKIHYKYNYETDIPCYYYDRKTSNNYVFLGSNYLSSITVIDSISNKTLIYKFDLRSTYDEPRILKLTKINENAQSYFNREIEIEIDSILKKNGCELYNKDPNFENNFRLHKKNTELIPLSLDVWIFYGDDLKKLVKFDDAILAYKKALEIEPNNNVLKERLNKIQNSK